MKEGSEPSPAQLFLAAVGEQVMTYREASGLTHDGLAKLSGLTAEQIDKLEHGWFDPTLSDIQAIASALDVSAHELLDVAGSALGIAAGVQSPR